MFEIKICDDSLEVPRVARDHWTFMVESPSLKEVIVFAWDAEFYRPTIL
ncbi:hypothetical protein [uncultured Roseovarius sp.]|tara:strand:- start:1210 stop:1356 length:147 start_codon:yes stop_codon:yes gene_type:complete